MKHLGKILLGSILLSGLPLMFSGCVTDGYVGESVYYGPHYRDPWFHDDPWMDGGRWGREGPRSGGSVGVYIHPPRGRH